MQKDYEQGVDKSSTMNWSQPRFNVSKGEISPQSLNDLDQFVIVGTTKNGQTAIASNVSQDQVRQLLRQHATSLLPQTA